MTNTTEAAAPATINASWAERLATALEMIAEDLQAPLEIGPSINRESGEVMHFSVALMLPDAHVTPGTYENDSAQSRQKPKAGGIIPRPFFSLIARSPEGLKCFCSSVTH